MIERHRLRWATMAALFFCLSACSGSGSDSFVAPPDTGGTSPPSSTPTPPPTAAGSVTLSWTPPTQNEDGTALLDLAGYRIYYGLDSGSFPNTIEIDNPGIATYVVDDLQPDTYYFVATAVNSAGVESAYSNVAVKVVD